MEKRTVLNNRNHHTTIKCFKYKVLHNNVFNSIYIYENNIEKSKEIAVPSVQAQKWN